MSGSMTRRGVLTGAAALAGVTSLPRFLGVPVIGHVVVDERTAHSAAFAAAFDGARLHTVNALGDLCNYWYTQMRGLVLADARPLAGLSSWIDYIVMERCAAEIGYRRGFHSEHLLSPDSSPSWAHALGRALARGAPRAPDRISIGIASDEVRMIAWVFSPRSH